MCSFHSVLCLCCVLEISFYVAVGILLELLMIGGRKIHLSSFFKMFRVRLQNVV